MIPCLADACILSITIMYILLCLLCTVLPAHSICKTGFETIGKWCFSFQLESKSLPKSREICNKIGGNMVLLDEYIKLELLRKYIKEKGLLNKMVMKNRGKLLNSYQNMNDAKEYAHEYCKSYYKDKLLKSTEELYIPNAKLPINFDENERARLTTPAGFSIRNSSIPKAGLGVWTNTKIHRFTVLGEYEGEEHLIWLKNCRNGIKPINLDNVMTVNEDDLNEKKHYIDARSPAKSNWLRYVNCARNVQEENVYSFPCDGLVFYMTTSDVEPDTELLTWYGKDHGLFMGIERIHPAKELDLISTAYIRLSYMPRESLQNYLDYHRNWFSRKYEKKSNGTYHGILDSYRDGKWRMQRENNYTFYTGYKGLLLPFVCEHEALDTN